MSRPEITTPESLADESVVELSLRPQRLAEFIGQGKVKDALRIYIDAATAHRVVEQHQPPTADMAIVVLGRAAEIRAKLEAKLGPMRVVTPEQCGRLGQTP